MGGSVKASGLALCFAFSFTCFLQVGGADPIIDAAHLRGQSQCVYKDTLTEPAWRWLWLSLSGTHLVHLEVSVMAAMSFKLCLSCFTLFSLNMSYSL